MQSGWRIKDYPFIVTPMDFRLSLEMLLAETREGLQRKKDILFLMAGASARGGNVENLLERVTEYFESICELAIKEHLCEYAVHHQDDLEEVPEF